MRGAVSKWLSGLSASHALYAFGLVAGISVWLSVAARQELTPDGEVCIIVYSAGIAGISIAVPEEYLGPSFLRMAKANRKGGRHKTVVLEIGYPSLKPWPSLSPESQTNETNVFVMVGPAVGGRLKLLFEGEPNGFPGWIKQFAPTSENKYGLEFYGRAEGGFEEGYYARFDDPTRNVIITCGARPPTGRCKGYFETPNRLSLVIHLPKSSLPEWEQIVGDLRSFAASLVLPKENDKCPA